MDGILVVDKPAGMTSHDVVGVVRKRLHERRVGHAGTLDPDATGLLLLGVGKATRFLTYAQSSPKRYRAVARFGVSTSTQDASGEVIATHDASRVESGEVEKALSGLRGDIEQIPPMVSAVKIGGERLYRKARRGEEVERSARRVTVYDLALLDFAAGERPVAELDVRCSAGTYVRTLIHDLGERLGCGAHLERLRRVEAGGFDESDARPLDELGAGDVLPLAEAVRELRRLEVSAEAAEHVRHGRPLTNEGIDSPVAVMRDGDLLGVYRPQGDRLVPERVVPA